MCLVDLKEDREKVNQFCPLGELILQWENTYQNCEYFQVQYEHEQSLCCARLISMNLKSKFFQSFEVLSAIVSEEI